MNTGALGNAENPFIAIATGPLSLGLVEPDKVLYMSQIELFDI